ncbi:MAG: nitrogenase component 1 [Elusimicrobiota bacterium]
MADSRSLRLNLPYLLGVYAAVNTVRDAYLLVDGPQCISFKAEHLSGKHDWRSTLLDPSGYHRIVMTGTTWDTVTFSREQRIKTLLDRVLKRPDAGLVMVSSLTMCGLSGIQYDRLIKPLSRKTRTPFLEIRCDSLDQDWLDGYASVWEEIARNIDLGRSKRERNAVAVVGHLMDRNEGDQNGNLAELKRMFKALGLDLASAWPSGGPYADLTEARRASAVISLPYARKAASALARRLKVPLIETELPFGLDASTRWVRKVAATLGRDTAAERFIDAELRRVVPPLEWAAPQVFLNRRLLYLGDPHLLEGFCEIAALLGARVEASAVVSREGRLGPRALALDPPPLVEPEETALLAAVKAGGPYDLCVANNVGWQVLGLEAGPVMEFGFPSYFHHALASRPFLGFLGFLNFADRLSEHLMLARMRAVSERTLA